MKKLSLLLAFATLAFTAIDANATYVRGHTRNDGTYVAPHHRSDANGNRFDNYSTRGNYNPYTGQKGYTDPYDNGY